MKRILIWGWVLSLCLGVRAVEALAVASEKGRAEPVVLLPIPILGAKMDLTAETVNYLRRHTDEVLRGDVRSLTPIEFLEPATASEDFVDLVDPRDREARAHLAAQLAKVSAEGALAYWLEGDVKKKVYLVALLYLPNKLLVEGITVSANLERQVVPLPEGKLPQEVAGVFKAVVERNLARIIASGGAQGADTASTTDVGKAPGGSLDLVPSAGGEGLDLVPGAPSGGLTVQEMSIPTTSPAFARRRGRAFPTRIGVLPFSSEFSSGENAMKKQFGALALKADKWQEATVKAVQSSIDAVPMDGPTLSFEQVEGSEVTIDPNYDPTVKYRKLERWAKDEGADALLIGHLQENRKGEQAALVVSLHLFLTKPYALETERVQLYKPVTRKVMRDQLGAMIQRFRDKVFRNKPSTGGADDGLVATTGTVGDILYKVRSGDNLTAIAKKCFLVVTTKSVEWLAQYNRLPNPNHLDPFQSIRIPAELDGHPRRCITH